MTYRDIVHRLGITEDQPDTDDFDMSNLEEFVAIHADI